MNWIRVVLAVCVAYGYVMEQLDPDTEFLNSDLVKLVFINAPFGVKNAKSRLCKLTKAIYEQVQELWCIAMSHVKRPRNGVLFTYVCICVKLFFAAKTSDAIHVLKDTFKNPNKMKGSGVAKFILAMEVDYNKNTGTLMIKRTRYIDDVVKRFNQQNTKIVENPCAADTKQ
uniref:Putative polyprotein n=1 Tax=Albugo laibachii Nc14 TaxID=890382 RepID=F0X2C1_9STRA|nr:putative polyprotein [Albugo laibachii Nc14]|eukprot:CCA28005.1 putative polyprotein [Albugo laibachii Nc14]